MSTDTLLAINLETGNNPTHTIIWMHGLGADGNDFVPIVKQLRLPPGFSIRFVFPHAPTRPVSINNGLEMRAWYDISDPDLGHNVDEKGIHASQKAIDALIEQQIEQGIKSKNIILAGFSQGGVMALQTGLRQGNSLAGIIALSCYLPLTKTLAVEAHQANLVVPILMMHGTSDPVVSVTHAKTSRDLLSKADYAVEWHEYPIEHSVCAEEIVDISNWLQRIIK